MPEILGKNIREVWDYRLSTATPLIVRDGSTWVVQIWAKDNPDYDPKNPQSLAKPLEVHDTGIPSEPGDHRDEAKIKACFEWLFTVRDKYARADIEEIKPVVAAINEANAKLAKMGAA